MMIRVMMMMIVVLMLMGMKLEMMAAYAPSLNLLIRVALRATNQLVLPACLCTSDVNLRCKSSSLRGNFPLRFKFEKCCHNIFLHFILAQFDVSYDIFMRKFKSAYVIPHFGGNFPLRFKIRNGCHINLPRFILVQFDVSYDT